MMTGYSILDGFKPKGGQVLKLNLTTLGGVQQVGAGTAGGPGSGRGPGLGVLPFGTFGFPLGKRK